MTFNDSKDIEPSGITPGLRNLPEHGIEVYLDEDSYLQASWQDKKHTSIYLHEVNAAPEGEGIGTLLVSHFFEYCRSNDIHTIESYVINPRVLSIYKKLAKGESPIHFFTMVEDNRVELPMTVGQAQTSIVRAQIRDAVTGYRNEPDLGIHAMVNLDEIR